MYKKLLNAPFHSNLIVANLVFSALISFLVWGSKYGGMFVIPGFAIIVPMFIQYCIDVGHQAVFKGAEPPIYELRSVNYQAIIFAILVIGLGYTAYYFLGNIWGPLLLSLLFPAMISGLIVQEHLAAALNPVEWLSYIVILKHRYLVLVFILIVADLAAALIPAGLWLWPKYFIAFSIITWQFYALGIFLNEHKEALQIITPDTHEERQQQYEEAEDSRQFKEMTDRWHRLSEVHKYQEANDQVADYLVSLAGDIDKLEQVMVELCSWRDTTIARKMLEVYIAAMLKQNKAGMAYAKYRMLSEADGPLPLENDENRRAILQFAIDMHDNDIADFLVDQAGESS